MTPSGFSIIGLLVTLFKHLPMKTVLLIIIAAESLYILTDHYIYDLSPNNQYSGLKNDNVEILKMLREIERAVKEQCKK